MNEDERKEQEKNRSYMIELNEINENHESAVKNGKKNGLFEIQNTLQEENNVSKNGHDSHLKLFNADTDVDESNADEDDANEKSSRFNNTSAGTDFHLEMSASILHPNQSMMSNNKSLHEPIPDTMVDEDEDEKKSTNDVKKESNENKNKPDQKNESDKCKLNGIHDEKIEEVGDTLIINEESNDKSEATFPMEKIQENNETKISNGHLNVVANTDDMKDVKDVPSAKNSDETIEKTINDEKNVDDKEVCESNQPVKANLCADISKEPKLEENQAEPTIKTGEEIKCEEKVEQQIVEENKNVMIEETKQESSQEPKNPQFIDDHQKSVDEKSTSNKSEKIEVIDEKIILEKENIIEDKKDKLEENKVGEVSKSVEEGVKPVEEVVKPVEEVVKPVEEVVKPVEEVVKSVEEVVKPVEEVVKPVEDVVKPVEEVVKPVEDVVKPVEDVVKPVEEVVKPVEEVVKPVEEVVKPVEEVVKPVEEVEKTIEENVTAPRRGRRSVAKQQEKPVVAEEEQSNSRPKRSVRTSIAPPSLPVASIPKTKAESKRKSGVVEPEPVASVESKNVSNEESNNIQQQEDKSEVKESNKAETDTKEIEKVVEISKSEEKAESQPAVEQIEETKIVQKETKKTEITEQANTTAPPTTGITRRSSLRIRSTAPATSNTAQVNSIKEKLVKKRNEAKKVEEEETVEKDDENEPTAAAKRTRKSVVAPVEVQAEIKKPTRGRKSVAAAVENNDQPPVVEEKPPVRQARVNRRTTIAVAPAQVQEARQKIAAASRTRKAAGPVVVKEVEETQELEEKTEQDKPKKTRRAASSETSKRKSTTTTTTAVKTVQNNIDTYHYDELDSNETNSNNSKRKRKTNTQQDESIIISNTIQDSVDVEKLPKKRSNSKSNDDSKLTKPTKKRNSKKLNASLNVQNTDNEDLDNDTLSKTLPFSAKLFFHSKRKTLPGGGSISSDELPTTNETETKNSKRYSYSSLLNNSKLNNDGAPTIIAAPASPTKQQSHNQSTNKKFKLHKAKSSSSEESSNDSDSDNEPLAAKKAKQNHSVSFKTPVEEKQVENVSEPVKQATVRRRNTVTKKQTATEVVETIQTTTTTTATTSRNSRNKKSSTAIPKIMATGVILNEKQKQIITNLGGEIVNDPKDATHLITNKIRKTCKFLSCLNKGVFIVNERWLEESNKAKMFANPSAYALADSQCEKQYKFSLQTSLLKAKNQQLFQDWKFILIHEDSPQEELSRSDIKTIIECGNGELVEELPTNETELANCCIIYSNLAKYKKDTQFTSKDLLKMTLDTFLNSILKQSFDIFHKIDQQNE